MRNALVSLLLITMIALQYSTAEDASSTHTSAASAARAERFFRGEYGGEPSVIDEFASENVIVSYPIFEKIYGKVALRGTDDVKVLCTNFVRKWVDRKLDIREVVANDNRVVLVWGFQARFVNDENDPPSDPVRWSGISIFCFDENGKIEKEYGLESQPGSFSELLTGELTDDIGR